MYTSLFISIIECADREHKTPSECKSFISCIIIVVTNQISSLLTAAVLGYKKSSENYTIKRTLSDQPHSTLGKDPVSVHADVRQQCLTIGTCIQEDKLSNKSH